MTVQSVDRPTDPFVEEMIADYVADCRITARRTDGVNSLFWTELADRLSA